MLRLILESKLTPFPSFSLAPPARLWPLGGPGARGLPVDLSYRTASEPPDRRFPFGLQFCIVIAAHWARCEWRAIPFRDQMPIRALFESTNLLWWPILKGTLMPVHRAIFRLDFKTNFRIIDHPGEILALIDSMPDKFWSELRESRTEREVQATFKSELESRLISVQPTTAFCAFESSKGYELRNLLDEPVISKVLTLVKQVCDKYQVAEIKRAGFRVFQLEEVTGSKSDSIMRLRKSVDPTLNELVAEGLGEIKDIGLHFDGSHPDGIDYHLRVGPFSADEVSKFFNDIPIEIGAATQADFIWDIDLYETQFATPNVSLTKYFTPMVDKASNVVANTKKTFFKLGG